MYEESVKLHAAIIKELDGRAVTAGGTPEDKIRAAVITRVNNERVKKALHFFGTAENYFACQDLSTEDFAAYEQSIGRKV